MSVIPKEVWQAVLSYIYQSNSSVMTNMSGSESYTDLILMSYRSGGSSGGNCYGDHTSSYSTDYSERASDLEGEFYFLEDLKTYIKQHGSKEQKEYFKEKIPEIINNYTQSLTHDYIDEYETDCDYYGNYSAYHIVGANILNVMRDLLLPEDFTQFETVYEAMKPVEEHRLLIEHNLENYQEVVKDIDNFETTTRVQKAELEKNIKKQKDYLSTLEKKLTNFDKAAAKQKQVLENKKANLEVFFEQNNIQAKTKKANKAK